MSRALPTISKGDLVRPKQPILQSRLYVASSVVFRGTEWVVSCVPLNGCESDKVCYFVDNVLQAVVKSEHR